MQRSLKTPDPGVKPNLAMGNPLCSGSIGEEWKLICKILRLSRKKGQLQECMGKNARHDVDRDFLQRSDDTSRVFETTMIIGGIKMYQAQLLAQILRC